jgi:hypothetical protein
VVFQETALKQLRIAVALHLILGPYAIWIMAGDALHAERWDTWYRNPVIAIPYGLALEAVIWGILLHQRRKEKKCEEGIRRLQEAIRLQEERRYEEAEMAYQEGLRLTGQK